MKYTPIEIHDQYAALAKTVAETRRREADLRGFFAQAAPKRLICIGCGSSFMLSRSMASIANLRAGTPAMAFAAGDVWLNAPAYAHLFEGAAVLALSRSGATSEVLNAVGAMRELAKFSLLSIVCAEDTPLEKASDACVVLPWAFDRSVCQTRCVTNLYAAGAMAVSLMDASSPALFEDFGQAAKAGDAYLAANEEALKSLAARDWRRAVVLADGALDGIAEEGALAFNEICQLPSNYHHILDVRHGPMVLADKKTLVIVMRATDACAHEDKLVADLVAKGACVVVCGAHETNVPGVAHQANIGFAPGSPARAALYLSVCQLLAYHKSTLNGSDPDAPEGLSAWIKL